MCEWFLQVNRFEKFGKLFKFVVSLFPFLKNKSAVFLTVAALLLSQVVNDPPPSVSGRVRGADLHHELRPGAAAGTAAEAGEEMSARLRHLALRPGERSAHHQWVSPQQTAASSSSVGGGNPPSLSHSLTPSLSHSLTPSPDVSDSKPVSCFQAQASMRRRRCWGRGESSLWWKQPLERWEIRTQLRQKQTMTEHLYLISLR